MAFWDGVGVLDLGGTVFRVAGLAAGVGGFVEGLAVDVDHAVDEVDGLAAHRDAALDERGLGVERVCEGDDVSLLGAVAVVADLLGNDAVFQLDGLEHGAAGDLVGPADEGRDEPCQDQGRRDDDDELDDGAAQIRGWAALAGRLRRLLGCFLFVVLGFAHILACDGLGWGPCIRSLIIARVSG